MLSILMPAYNEASSIAENVCETVETMRALGVDFEIVVIDDGSLDGTHTAAIEALRAWPDHVRVVRCRRNEGKGNALICGASYSQRRVRRVSRRRHGPASRAARELLRDHEARGADVVIGSKFHPESQVDYPRLRRIYSFFYFLLVRALFGLAGARYADRHQALQARSARTRAAARVGEAIRLRPRAACKRPSLRLQDRRSAG